jgi:hypothetical protein
LFYRNHVPHGVIAAHMERNGDSGPGPEKASLVMPGGCLPEVKGEHVVRKEITHATHARNPASPLGIKSSSAADRQDLQGGHLEAAHFIVELDADDRLFRAIGRIPRGDVRHDPAEDIGFPRIQVVVGQIQRVVRHVAPNGVVAGGRMRPWRGRVQYIIRCSQVSGCLLGSPSH